MLRAKPYKSAAGVARQNALANAPMTGQTLLRRWRKSAAIVNATGRATGSKPGSAFAPGQPHFSVRNWVLGA
jgi:hypothetical protein